MCHHTKTLEIDDALVSGATLRTVADGHGLSKSALARHRKGCLAPKIAAALRVVAPSPTPRAEVVQAKAIVSGEVLPTHDDLLSLSGLLARLARSLGRLDDAADRAVTEDRPMALAALSGQLHRGIETTAKLQGLGNETREPDRPPTSITIIVPERNNGPRFEGEVVQNSVPRAADVKLSAGLSVTPERLVMRFGSCTPN